MGNIFINLQLTRPDGYFDSFIQDVFDTGTNDKHLLHNLIGKGKAVKEVTTEVFDDNSDGVPANLVDFEVHLCINGRLFHPGSVFQTH